MSSPSAPSSCVDVSVIVATYNRQPLLERLLAQLAEQTLAADRFEVVVVDDGSREDVRARLAGARFPYRLLVERQANAGAGAARHRGVGIAAGRVLVFVDDDMQLPPGFLEAHLRQHDADPRAVVLGEIRRNTGARPPVFERFHLRMLERFARDVKRGRAKIDGTAVCTGNLSVKAADYAAVGGFDVTLGRSEDAELGLRLEKHGARFVFSEDAHTVHDTDHTDVEVWLDRAYRYGVEEVKIARKHPDLPHADPWRYVRAINPLMRPFFLASIAAPGALHRVARTAIAATTRVDAMGLERVALAGATLVYAIEYARGVRAGSGTLGGSALGYARHRSASGSRGARLLGAAADMVAAVREDHAVLRRYGAKYGRRIESTARDLPRDLVQKVGFQMMAAYRLMRFFRDAGVPLAPKLVSRAMRHLYAADVHWDAEFEPGVMIVHGMGLAISHAARVGRGAILFQNVTLGEGIDPATREVGAPAVGRDVHVGAGATLVGPIAIGARSKVMAGCVLLQSVPEDSLVETPRPEVKPRVRPRSRVAE